MTEQLLHYIWRHKLFLSHDWHTTAGQRVEVIDPGLRNTDAGPDFFNAKILLDGVEWAGNVEIHGKASDWNLHGHQHDEHYDNVVLHVCRCADAAAVTSQGRILPQAEMEIPQDFEADCEALMAADSEPPCARTVAQLDAFTVHAWLNALQTERLERKTNDILQRLRQCDGSWEQTCFVTLARNFGFGVNGLAFEQWALSLPLHSVDHHRDDPLAVEALFFGQAGLLNEEQMPASWREKAGNDAHFCELRATYTYLSRKFSLVPVAASLWRFLRLRPQNFPHLRIARLAHLHFLRRTGLRSLLECATLKDVEERLQIGIIPYWETHYRFGAVSKQSDRQLSAASLQLIVINTVVPLLFAYGRTHSDERLCEQALQLLEQAGAENNHVVRRWKACGVQAKSAADTQALLQLQQAYCDRRDCLRCRFGYEYLKRKAGEASMPKAQR